MDSVTLFPVRFIALDIGLRRTGVAFFDEETGIPLPLDTIVATDERAFSSAVLALAAQRGVDQVVVGLPLLPSGEEGSQAAIVRERASLLGEAGLRIVFQDERYTTPRKGSKMVNFPHAEDGDAAAACEILRSYLKC